MSKKKIIYKLRRKNIVKVGSAQPWIFKKLNQTAGIARAINNGVHFGLPKINQIIFPGKTARVNTGWSAQQIPQGGIMTTMVHKQLLDNNIIGLPSTIDFSQAGGQLIQTILNNGDQPIKIQFLNEDQGPKLIKLHPQTLLQTQNLQFNFGNFLGGVCTAGMQVATLFA